MDKENLAPNGGRKSGKLKLPRCDHCRQLQPVFRVCVWCDRANAYCCGDACWGIPNAKSYVNPRTPMWLCGLCTEEKVVGKKFSWPVIAEEAENGLQTEIEDEDEDKVQEESEEEESSFPMEDYVFVNPREEINRGMASLGIYRSVRRVHFDEEPPLVFPVEKGGEEAVPVRRHII